MSDRPRFSDIDFLTTIGAVDEHWLGEWIEFGIRELERHLHNDAIYREWCERTGRRP